MVRNFALSTRLDFKSISYLDGCITYYLTLNETGDTRSTCGSIAHTTLNTAGSTSMYIEERQGFRDSIPECHIRSWHQPSSTHFLLWIAKKSFDSVVSCLIGEAAEHCKRIAPV